MIWIDSISELQYYNQPKGVPCYCETLVYSSDLILQGVLGSGTTGFGITLYTYSADGLTQYENVTSYFNYYFAQNPVTLQTFFNAKLKSFAPSMCLYKCFLIRAVITRSGQTIFDKYTERYCQTTCCDIAQDIDISQALLVGGTTLTPTDTTPKVTDCGDRLITLRTRFDCYDQFLGNYFGIPNTVYSGTASFAFDNITTFKGRIVRRPREISREYSYNCRLQRAESKPVYRLEGYEYFPAWKMNEIEAQLHSTEIYVEGIRYEYSGGTPFRMINNCIEVFKLDTQLEDCMIRQVFGCDTSCGQTLNFDGAMKMFIVPDGYNGGSFYDESGVLIAEDFDGLLEYIRNMDGIYQLTEYNPASGFGCDIYGAFSISGYAALPSYFYFDSVTGANKFFGAVYGSADEICDNFLDICGVPEIGDITITETVCETPEIGTVTISDVTPTELTIVGYGNWEIVDAGTDASVNASVVSMNIEVINSSMTEDPDNPGEPVFIANQVIGVISVGGRPTVDVTLNSTNSSLPADTYLTISTNGFIYYQGETTSVSDINVTIALTNLNYNL